MPAAKKKTAVKPVRAKRFKAKLVTGPDGSTMPERLETLMRAADPPVTQSELARQCSDYFRRFYPNTDEKVKQQHIFNLLGGQASAEYLPLVCVYFDVNELWLQYGIGPKMKGGR